MQHVTPDLLLWTSDIEICFPLARPLTSTSLAPATECVVSSALNSGRTQLAHKVAWLHYSTVQYITVSTSTGYLDGHQTAVEARFDARPFVLFSADVFEFNLHKRPCEVKPDYQQELVRNKRCNDDLARGRAAYASREMFRDCTSQKISVSNPFS